jgi:hypothetical protein
MGRNSHIKEKTMISIWRKTVSKWLQRLHYKTWWENYQNDVISYATFKDYVFQTVNSIRRERGDAPYAYAKFDEGWQYRKVCYEKYKTAYDELLNLIFGWW